MLSALAIALMQADVRAMLDANRWRVSRQAMASSLASALGGNGARPPSGADILQAAQRTPWSRSRALAAAVAADDRGSRAAVGALHGERADVADALAIAVRCQPRAGARTAAMIATVSDAQRR